MKALHSKFKLQWEMIGCFDTGKGLIFATLFLLTNNHSLGLIYFLQEFVLALFQALLMFWNAFLSY